MIAIVHSIYSQSVHALALNAGSMDNDAGWYCTYTQHTHTIHTTYTLHTHKKLLIQLPKANRNNKNTKILLMSMKKSNKEIV